MVDLAFGLDNTVPFEGSIHMVAWRSPGEVAGGSVTDCQQGPAAVDAGQDENVGRAVGNPAKVEVGPHETGLDILDLGCVLELGAV